MKNYKKNGRLWLLNAEQNSQMWLDEKAGILSSSSATFKVTKKGEPTADSKKLIVKKASERFLGKIESIKSKYFDYGHEKEPLPIAKYELRTGFKVEKIGFARLVDYPFIGDSPDGVVGYNATAGEADIVIEVKSHAAPFEFGNVIKNGHPDFYKYKEQILHHFLVFNAKEVHHISYCEHANGDMFIFISILVRADFEEEINTHFEMCKIAEPEIVATLEEIKTNMEINQLIF